MKIINWRNNYLSKLCLGTVQFGLNYGISNNTGKTSKIEANSILEFSESVGINCIDTAKVYGNSEEIIGDFIRHTSNNTFNVISKVNSEILSSSEDILIDEINNSLDKLSIKSLFGLLLHDNSLLHNFSVENKKSINKLKELKLIENFGVSIYSDAEFLLALNNDEIDIIQIPFSLVDQRAITKHWLKKAKEKNKLIFIRSIYLQGLILMDKDDLPSNLNTAKKYVEILDFICNKLNITKNELELSFVNTRAKDAIILFGCDSLTQAKENISNFNNLVELDDETLTYLGKKLSNINENIYNPSKWSKK